jgi:hypothetical protein
MRHWMQGHKLKQRIAFRNELTPPREVHSIEGDEIVYELTAVVVHVGTTLAHGVATSLTHHSHKPLPCRCLHRPTLRHFGLRHLVNSTTQPYLIVPASNGILATKTVWQLIMWAVLGGPTGLCCTPLASADVMLWHATHAWSLFCLLDVVVVVIMVSSRARKVH